MTAVILSIGFLVGSMYYALNTKGYEWVYWNCFNTPVLLLLAWLMHAAWILLILPLPKWGDVPL